MHTVRLLPLLFVLALPIQVSAELQLRDWQSAGDGLLLRDTSTGLEWLRLPQSQGLSVNDVTGQWFGNTEVRPPAGKFAGFRYATRDQVVQLYRNFGLATIDNSMSEANVVGANVAFQALGFTGQRLPVTVQEGFYLEAGGGVGIGAIVLDNRSARAFAMPANNFDFDREGRHTASYLVRTVAVAPKPIALTGTVAFRITLKRGSKAVTTLKAGTYSIKVNDNSSTHNFHLRGPGVDKKTGLAAKTSTTWTVQLKPGTYTYFCDRHASTVKGVFKVTK